MLKRLSFVLAAVAVSCTSAPCPAQETPKNNQAVEWPHTEGGCQILAQNMGYVAQAFEGVRDKPEAEQVALIKKAIEAQFKRVDTPGQDVFKDPEKGKQLLGNMIVSIAGAVIRGGVSADQVAFSVFKTCTKLVGDKALEDARSKLFPEGVPQMPPEVEPKGPQIES